jgi:putative CocE/NonD family hydrolase
MKSLNIILTLCSLLFSYALTGQAVKGTEVIFPKVSGPFQVTRNNKEHLFASYYGINSFDRSGRYITVLETDIRFKLADENEPATLGLVDLKTNNFIPLTETHAWNFQQGCMAHWLGTSPDSLIIYNDLRNGKFISVIMNVHTRKEIRTIQYPVSAVSPDGKEALSINFARLRLTRPDYGYAGAGQDPKKEIQFPDDDGIFLVDLVSFNSKLIVSYRQLKDLVPPVTDSNILWINHTLFSRKGSKIFFLARQLDNKSWTTTSFTVNRDGTNLQRSFPDNWAGSHFDWLNDNELMVTANWEGKQYCHVLFTPVKKDFQRLGNGMLDFDGHGTFSPDGKWMITDTYPDQGMREQKIYLMDMKTGTTLSLGRFYEPEEFSGHWRCDLHCRWSPDGTMIGFNSTRTGSRQVYIFRLNTQSLTSHVIEELDVKVPMRDGVRLSTNIYRPDAPGKFPVLLMRSPYGNGGAGNSEASSAVSRGYVVILQDTRGRYESEGVFDAMQPEGTDGYDTQQWAGQQAWCNGKIGTFGGSYVGFTQWMPAPFQSPYLVTMMPVVTFSDFHDVVYQNGAFRLELFGLWSFEMTHPYTYTMDSLAKHEDKILMSLPLIDQDKQLGWKIPFLRDWLMHPEHDSYWERTSVGDGYSKITASVYNIGGWYDILLKGTLNNFIKMTGPTIDPEIRKKQKILIGPWVHDEGKRKVGELDFGESAELNEEELMMRWFDNQLKGTDNGMNEEPPVKIFVMGENRWRYENEWPLARTSYEKYYFHSRGKANSSSGDGSMNTDIPVSPALDKFTYDPNDPVRTIGSMGPYDQKQVEIRSDVLVYTTDPLKEDIEVTGPVNTVLYASSSARNTDFTAKLVDVYPDGRAIRICEGIIRADHRNQALPPTNIEPGRIYKYTIDLWATSNLFKKSHRIRVEISSSNFPRFDRNLNTGNYFATDTTVIKAEQVIYHSAEYPSNIVLPVIRK